MFVLLAIIIGTIVHFILEYWKSPPICVACKNKKAAHDIWSILDIAGRTEEQQCHIDNEEELSD